MINEVKMVVKNYIDSAMMTKIVNGKVLNVSPLEIKIGNEFTIPEQLVHVPTWLKDGYSSETTHFHKTEESSNHFHTVLDSGKHNHQIYFKLKKGDDLILLRNWGGQKYFVLDVMKK